MRPRGENQKVQDVFDDLVRDVLIMIGAYGVLHNEVRVGSCVRLRSVDLEALSPILQTYPKDSSFSEERSQS
jgi:hypothetical protein